MVSFGDARMHAEVASEWLKYLDIAQSKFRKYDKAWRTRSREIDTETLFHFIVRCLLSKGSQGYSTTLTLMWLENMKIVENHRSKPFAASSICEARQKLSPNVFREINADIIEQFEEQSATDEDLWNGFRLFAIDSTSIHLPPMLLKSGYKATKHNEFYPLSTLSCLYRLKTGVPYDFVLDKNRSEKKAAERHLELLKQGDVVVYDRGYYSFHSLEAHTSENIHAIYRMRYTACQEVKDFYDSNKTEEIVNIKGFPLRLMRYEIEEKIYVLGTTIFSKKLKIKDFAEVYHARWGVEELIKSVKNFIDVEDFHSKNERGILQEIYASKLLLTITRLLARETEISKQDQNKKKQELSTNTRDTDFQHENGDQTLKGLSQLLEGILNR